ncbi:universal stress protein [Natronomonas salina]|uniref:universal stress protein n=1 Tax=Natronomonas salina TaxID=1710540 RepID=UPI0015B7380B|nr:universal stress protein [Natronomonas salina]QLD91019.1 universal stress protein [Natronomonas salina]
MHHLVATDSVHTTAAACDYLAERLGSDDRVTVVSVPGEDARDADDALNVANARLIGTAEVETERLDGDADPASAVLAAANARNADVIVVGPHAGTPSAGPALGSTARRIVEGADVPVVVVPLSL